MTSAKIRCQQLDTLYRPLCRAVAGRILRFAPTTHATHCDGRVLFINGSLSDVRSTLVIQCLLLAAGSLEPGVVRHLVGQPERIRRYLTLEVARVCREAPLLPRLILGTAVPLSDVVSGSPGESLGLSSNKAISIVDAEFYGAIRPIAILAVGIPSRGGGGPPARGSAARGDEGPPELGDDEEATNVPRVFRRFMTSVLDFSTPWASAVRRFFGIRGALGGDEGEGGGGGLKSTSWRMRSGDALEHRGAAGDFQAAPPDPTDEHILVTTWRYPEWDVDRGCYRPDWCAVHEISCRDLGDLGEPRRVRRDPWLERGLRHMAQGLARVNRQVDGDELDFNALLTHVVDLEHARRDGGAPDSALIYSRQVRQTPDFSALVAVDISGSTGERASGAERITDLQITFAETLIHSLSQVMDSSSAMAFHSSGRDKVRVVRLKKFDGQWTHQASRALRALQPSGYTRLGAILRHTAREQEQKGGHQRKVTVVVSDGHPFDEGYSGHHAWADVAMALGEARRQGIGIVWLCIGDMSPRLQAALARFNHEAVVMAAEAFHPGRIQRLLLASMRSVLQRDNGREARTFRGRRPPTPLGRIA